MPFSHLSYDERVIIEDRLNHNQSIRSISSEISKSPSTVMREIRTNSERTISTANNCAHRQYCDIHNLCGQSDCMKLCKKCVVHPCKKVCEHYEILECPRLSKTPYVCNGCTKQLRCYYSKCYYHAHSAERQYKERLREKRSGFDLTEDQIQEIDRIASPLIRQGLSPYHILSTHQLPVSEVTLRRMIASGVITARNIDLRDAVKRKVRNNTKNKDRIARMTISKIGHTYKDYLNFISENEIPFTVEMDCVEGIKDEDTVLLTLTWRELSMQLAFLLERHTAEEVVRMLNVIEEALGPELFTQMFPVILTDNGTEFSDIQGMERSITGSQRTKVYFCEPNRSDQKGTCENHHRMIRFCIPKGTPLSKYNQMQISTMMNHINSYKRKNLFGKSAYDIAKAILPEDFFILLGLEIIPADDIKLNKEVFLS